MKDAIIGFMAGVIMSLGLIASSAGSLRDEVVQNATNSGYLVTDGKAYTVQQVK